MKAGLITAAIAGALFTQQAAAFNATSKRGTSWSFLTVNHELDYNELLSNKSPISWYYTWSLNPAPLAVLNQSWNADLEFVPTIAGMENITDIPLLLKLPASATHLFTFNEPDGDKPSGGSDITPEAAAQAYIDHLVPLRSRWKISHPSVTGSTRGLNWLTSFNESCWRIDPKNGCPTDFVVAHCYSDFTGLAWWVGELAKFYNIVDTNGNETHNGIKIWVKEFGIAQATAEASLGIMSQTVPYFDGLDWIARYSWFGVFRPKDANQWTGTGLSLFDDNGGLTALGAYYLGGNSTGFKVGDAGQPLPPAPTTTAAPTGPSGATVTTATTAGPSSTNPSGNAANSPLQVDWFRLGACALGLVIAHLVQ